MLVSLVLQTLGLRTRRRGRPNHRRIGFAVPRCPTFPLRNPPLMAPQESVGGLGCPLDQIRCRRHQLSCSWIHPHRQPWHHLYGTLNPRPKPKPPKHLHCKLKPLHTDANFHSEDGDFTKRSKFCKFKMADGRHIENRLLAIAWRRISRLMRNLDRRWRIIRRYGSRDHWQFSKI